MKAEYDFSKGERGKFYHPDAVFSFPVYLEPDVSDFMSQLADEKDVDIQELVNEGLGSILSWFRVYSNGVEQDCVTALFMSLSRQVIQSVSVRKFSASQSAAVSFSFSYLC
jgi:hypothetical protein